MDIPKIQDLVNNYDEAFKNDQLKMLLNQDPPKEWVKVNKYANNSRYLPIDKIEYLLDKIFQEWKIEILECKEMFNSIVTTVRVHYKNPLNGEWSYHDGVGGSELQTKKESGVLLPDFSNINSGAVELAAPLSKAMAIKDACDHIGRLFGRDLNRKDTIPFGPSYEPKKDDNGNSIKEGNDIVEQIEKIDKLDKLLEFFKKNKSDIIKNTNILSAYGKKKKELEDEKEI